MKLQISILDLVPVLGNASYTEAIEQAVRMARLADKLGYRRYWAAEHHDLDGLASASPEVLIWPSVWSVRKLSGRPVTMLRKPRRVI